MLERPSASACLCTGLCPLLPAEEPSWEGEAGTEWNSELRVRRLMAGSAVLRCRGGLVRVAEADSSPPVDTVRLELEDLRVGWALRGQPRRKGQGAPKRGSC